MDTYYNATRRGAEFYEYGDWSIQPDYRQHMQVMVEMTGPMTLAELLLLAKPFCAGREQQIVEGMITAGFIHVFNSNCRDPDCRCTRDEVDPECPCQGVPLYLTCECANCQRKVEQAEMQSYLQKQLM